MNWLSIGVVLVAVIPLHWTPSALGFPPASAEKLRGNMVEEWVTELSANDFSTRKAAAEKLVRAGADAADAVADAADSEDRELPLRCINVLKSMLHSEDAQTRTAAKSALKRLSNSPREFLASLAQKTLDAPPPAPAVIGPQFGGRMRINGGLNPRAKNIRINMKMVNGNRTISVEIDDKEIEISDANGQDITVKVTESVVDENGNTVREPKTYTAKTVEELQKNHPEAAKIYQQYAGAGFVPPPMRRIPFVRGRVEILKRQLERLDEMVERFEERAENGNFPAESLDRFRQSIDRQRARLAEQIESAEEAEQKANAE